MKENSKPLILISNDDGYNAGGIRTLIAVAREFGDVVVAAPMKQQSGKASAITITTPLRAKRVKQEEGLTVFLIDGTPADCVKLALDQLLEGRHPDLVLAGINHGYNVGVSTLYSGTMGATFEGLVHHVPSVAFSYGSYDPDADFTVCVPYVRSIIGRVLEQGLPKGTCLNVNIPHDKGELKGVKVTTTSLGLWRNEFERRTDPHGADYYWMAGYYEHENPDDETTDLYWIDRGWVSVTPCKVDQTARGVMGEIADLLT
ncbi:MAG: 5'/3'-nucleotidase SurE [Muribaculaceae bacterium]|nr:5'/3'-nucleotidase SurE [Muribaculaceae bacterium]